MPKQDTNVIKLSTDICCNNRDIARQLVALARKVKDGDFGNVRIATTVMDSDTGIERWTLGPPGTNRIETAGLLSYALSRLTTGV